MKMGGVDDGTRTRDSRNHNPGLSQLSYVHHRYIAASSLARPAGIEPATLGLEGRCSIRLSYGRLIRQPEYATGTNVNASVARRPHLVHQHRYAPLPTVAGRPRGCAV